MDRIRTSSSSKQRRTLLWASTALATVVVVALTGMVLKPAGYHVDRSAAVIGKVSQGPLEISVHGNGVLLPESISWIAAQVEGRVEHINVKAGASVHVGDILVELANPILQQTADEAHWSLEALQAELNALKVNLGSQRLNLKAIVIKAEFAYKSEQMKLDAENDLISRHGQVIPMIEHHRIELNAQQLQQTLAIERDRLENFEGDISAQISAKEAQIEKLRKQWTRTKDQVDALTIRASLDGIVQAMPLEMGQRLLPGSNIAKLADPSHLYAELKIPEQQARDLALNQKAEIDTRIGMVQGQVTRIDPAVVGGVVKVDVAISSDLPKGARPDLSVEGQIKVAALSNTIFVPRPALVQSNQQAVIYRFSDEHHAERIVVKFGIASVNAIEIQSGLKPGDSILLNDASNWGSPEHVAVN